MKGNINTTKEQQAQEQTKFLAGLIQHISQPVIIASADKRLCLWNAAFSKLTGYTDKELGDPIISAGLTAPEWHEGETKALEKLRRTGQTQTFQKEYIRKDGSRVPVEMLAYQVTGDAGKVKYYVGLITDITEHKQLEETLQKSEGHYRTLVDNAIEGIVVTQDGKIKFANPIVAVVSGYSIEELQSMSLKDLVCTDNEKAIIKSLSKAAAPGTLYIAPPFRIRTKAGESRWIEDTVVSIMWDDEAANLNLLRDITERKETDEIFSKSEEKYRTILEDMKEGYWEVDLAGNFTSFNDAICRILGYPKKEMMGMNYRAYTGAEDVDKVYKAFNQVYRKGKPIRNMHYEVIPKDGSKRFAETSVFPKRNDKGEIIGFRGVSHDVTERKEMEETLSRSEERYRTILDEMEDSYFEVDLAGNWTLVNDANCRQMGYSREELIGMNYRAIFASDDTENVYKTFNQVYITGQPSRGTTFKTVRKDGSTGVGEFSAFPLRNEKGEIIGFRGVGRDVTEHMRMEEALRQSEEGYRTILDEMEQGYFEADLAGNYILVNEASCRQLGYPKEELIGMNYRDIIASDDIENVYKNFNKVYRKGQPIRAAICQIVRKDGSTRVREFSVFPLRNNKGKIVGFRGVSRDITERMQMEEALRQSEKRYRTILEEIQDAYFEVDLVGNFTFGNDSFYRYLGYSAGELIGVNYRAITAADDAEKVSQGFNQVYRTGTPINNLAYKTVRKDGSTGYVEIAVNLVRNEKGEIIGFRGVGRDSTERMQITEALTRSEQRYRTIMDEMEEGYYETDIDGNYTFFNDAICNKLGYSREELMGMSFQVHTEPEDVKKIAEAYYEVYSTGKPLKWFSPAQIRKDGTKLFAEDLVSCLRNESGQVIGFRGISRDITDHLKMIEALRRSEERYRTVLEDIEEAYYEDDLAGNFTFVNDALCRQLGYSREELIGMNYRVYTPPEEVENVFQLYNQVYRTGKSVTSFHNREITKDGRQIIVELSLIPSRNERGEIIGFRGVGRDITGRLLIEKTLQQSEEKHRTILHSIDESYYEVDIAGNFTFFNDALCHQLGYSREELMGMSYKTYTPPDKVEGVFQAYNEVYRTGEPTKLFDMEQIRKDGTLAVIENSIFPLRNENGEIIGFRGIGRDITERKQMMETLRQSEERYRTILDETKEAYYEMDLGGNFTFFNDSLCHHLGYSREELMGMNFKVYVPPEKAKGIFGDYNRIYRTGESIEYIDVVQIRKDKKRIFVECSASPIRNESNQVIGFRGVMRDVTERKRVEEALKQSEERYRTVLEDMQEAYYELDLAGNYTLFNDALCHQLGYSKEELIGMNYRAYVPPEDVEGVFQTFNQIYRTGEPIRSFLMERIRKDGMRIFCETSGFPLRDETGEIVGFRGIIHDITDRKQADEEKRQLEQKAQLASRLASVGELASGVAHEINNPLTGVIGYAHLLLARTDIPKDMARDVEIINEGAQRVSVIVKKLLTFARQTRPEQRYVNINELINSTLDLQVYAMAANNIKVSLQLTRDLPMIIADPGQLQQVFLNLIMNAETAMKLTRTSGKLSIKTERTDNDVRISFKDNGPGIAKENLENIFDPFFTTREVGQGTGLGLSVCHGIIKEHKGTIWVESEPGKGATFIVELPIVTEDKQLEMPEPVIIEEPKKVAKAKILVVDDEPVIRQLVSQVLTDEGHEVETADNAADALKMVGGKRYRLILLDIKMPGMSGVELYKKFQKIAPSLTKRVVFITGDVMGKRTMDFLDKTKVHCLMKPFDAKQLKTDVKRILAKR